MTAMDGEPINDAWVHWAAVRTIDQHHAQRGQPWAPGTCRQCTPDGCDQLAWAQQVVGDHPVDRGHCGSDGVRTDDSDALTTESTVHLQGSTGRSNS